MNIKIVLSLCLTFFISTSLLFGQSGIDFYYGFEVKQDFKKAFQTFQKEGLDYYTNTPFVIIMFLNGEGVEMNVKKALEVWEKAEASITHGSSITMNLLKEKIDERLKNPEKKFPRIAFCEIGQTTIEMVDCESIKYRLKNQAIQNSLKQIRFGLNDKQVLLLKKIQSNYAIIENNDAGRIYNSYIEGSIRNVASTFTSNYLKDRHQKRLQTLLIEKKFPTYSEKDFIQADKALNLIYKKQKAQNLKGLERYDQPFYTDTLYKHDLEKLKWLKEAIKESDVHLKHAQLAWIKYRDNFSELVKSLDKDHSKDIEISVKTLLTMERTKELNYDPIRP